MNEHTNLKARDSAVTQQEREFNEPVLMPPVDIFEGKDGIIVKADLPGVTRDQLTIEVHDDTLSIDARASIDASDDIEPLYADVRATRYLRRFTLSRELASDKVSAQITDGVLTVTIPKREELRPRKIEVTAT